MEIAKHDARPRQSTNQYLKPHFIFAWIFPNCKNKIHCEIRKEALSSKDRFCSTALRHSYYQVPATLVIESLLLEECPTRSLRKIHFRLQVPWVHQLFQSGTPANVRQSKPSRIWKLNKRSCQKQSRNQSKGYLGTVVMMLSVSIFLNLKDRFWFLIQLLAGPQRGRWQADCQNSARKKDIHSKPCWEFCWAGKSLVQNRSCNWFHQERKCPPYAKKATAQTGWTSDFW